MRQRIVESLPVSDDSHFLDNEEKRLIAKLSMITGQFRELRLTESHRR